MPPELAAAARPEAAGRQQAPEPQGRSRQRQFLPRDRDQDATYGSLRRNQQIICTAIQRFRKSLNSAKKQQRGGIRRAVVLRVALTGAMTRVSSRICS